MKPALFLAALLLGGSVAAQVPTPAELLQAQRKALAPLAALDGVWRGTAKVWQWDGTVTELTQTERVGSMMDGALRVIEGRGYTADGHLHFQALAVISYNSQTRAVGMRSYAQGREGDFPFELTPDGFRWSMKAGPVTVRYTAVVKDGMWVETGERLMEGQAPAPVYEARMRRIGLTDWPAQGAVPPR